MVNKVIFVIGLTNLAIEFLTFPQAEQTN